ncbi:Multidrug resistance protein MdtA precursor [Rhodobacteraceae bacterium THAF1]|uniref:efflux RND transporter periplasmic adaptor subunit n=1 Tax=Palleronia sp. THAF1 TaxID=2587842 RepID=UPI000F3B74FB|nr:efflux RND transporter periplasmic adaptor subunit [Palleronia sp. THAF1]QFU09018.1 Multidrug resistance protein MdtA precursor [Palleronia sp. THAF1]VDC24233.1 Multidrug resistance protein MdtA precursor [Rhodobacteraceae bacterium THAF1]
MRLFSILTAILVAAGLYFLVLERDAVLDFAGATPGVIGAEADDQPGAPTGIAVVAMASKAQPIETAVVVRGQTEAARQVAVRAETTGKVVSDPLRKGAFVSEGDLLCSLDPGTRAVSLAEAKANLAQAEAAGPEAQARIAEAEARLVEAQINQNAASRLSEDGFASQTRVASSDSAVEAANAAIEAAKSGLESAAARVQSAQAAVAAAETELERSEITAPFGGLLESDTAEIGALLQAGGLCATVIQLDPVKLVGFVPEIGVDRVEVGAPAQARLASGQTATGRVTFLSRAADPQTRTFRTEIEVPNADLKIRDGQTVEIAIQAEGQQAHLLPQSALTLNDEGDLGVRVAEENDLAQFYEVSILRDSPQGVFVTGLPESARVIVLGQEYVSDGTPVVVTLQEAAQ